MKKKIQYLIEQYKEEQKINADKVEFFVKKRQYGEAQAAQLKAVYTESIRLDLEELIK